MKITEVLLAEQVSMVEVSTYRIELFEAEGPATDFWGIPFPTP